MTLFVNKASKFIGGIFMRHLHNRGEQHLIRAVNRPETRGVRNKHELGPTEERLLHIIHVYEVATSN